VTGGEVAVAIDLGTTGLKVGLVSFRGDVLWSDHAPLETSLLPDGGREQDAGEWWATISKMVRTGIATFRPESIAAVACTGQWASTVPVDVEGRPVGPCVMWQDTRGRRHARSQIGGPVAGYAPRAAVQWIRKTGGAPPLTRGPLGAHLFLTRDRPDIASAARWFLEPVDYLTMRLTGIASATQASMTAHFLSDITSSGSPGYGLGYVADLVARAGIDVTKLAPLRPTGTVVGPVRDDVADDLGIPRGVPVTTGLPDIHTAAAGSGAVLPGAAHLVVGTTSWISCPIERKKTDIVHEVLSIPGPTQGSYAVLNNIDTAGACLDWFRRLLTMDGTIDSAGAGAQELIELAATSPPGSRGVVFTPWLSGAQAPIADASARAGFHNITLDRTAADLSRAVLEGVAVQNALLLDVVETFLGSRRRPIRLEPIRIIGGGARSDLWCQMHADALDRTLERPVDPINAGLRGAALTAAMSLGAVKAAEVRDLVKVDSTFHPDPAHRPLFESLAAGIRKLHKAQKRPLAQLRRAFQHSGADVRQSTAD
jgi:xylulokinase